jgi:hypothetical protein
MVTMAITPRLITNLHFTAGSVPQRAHGGNRNQNTSTT